VVPYVYVTSGNENRVDGPFKLYASGRTARTRRRDQRTRDGERTGRRWPPAGAQPVRAGVRPGGADANCGNLPQEILPGNGPAATVFECLSVSGSVCNERLGRVFFGGRV